MKIRVFAVLFVVFVLKSSLFAANSLMLTDLGSSAEMMSVGNIEGFGKSSNAIFENPASLTYVDTSSFSAFTTSIFSEITYVNVSMAHRFPFGTLAVGYMDASVGGVPHTGQNTDSNQTHYALYEFDYKNTLLKVAYQKDLMDNLSAGISLSQYKIAFDDVSGEQRNFDVGLLWQLGPAAFSFNVRNVLGGVQVDYGKDESGNVLGETLPFQTSFGVQYMVNPSVDLLAQVKNSSGKNMLSLGGRYYLGFVPLSVNIGYKQFEVLDQTDDTLVFGLGLFLDRFRFHYAFEKSTHPSFDNKNYFSMSVGF
jgi:hypothetical protein